MYELILLIWMIFSYFFLSFFLQIFSEWSLKKASFSFLHVIIFVVFAFLSLELSLLIAHTWIANRFLHAVTGAFTMCIVFYFSFLASNIRLSRLQFFVICVLVVSFAGILNELLESYLQLTYWMQFSKDNLDTWFDLWSNTVWSIFGAIFFSTFIRKD